MAIQNKVQRLAGKRVMIVEDHFYLAKQLAMLLGELGCDVIGPMPSVGAALEAAANEQIDAAVLDINVRGEPVFPVAERLHARDVPLIFATGYIGIDIPEEFRWAPRLLKPFSVEELEDQLLKTFPVDESDSPSEMA